MLTSIFIIKYLKAYSHPQIEQTQIFVPCIFISGGNRTYKLTNSPFFTEPANYEYIFFKCGIVAFLKYDGNVNNRLTERFINSTSIDCLV